MKAMRRVAGGAGHQALIALSLFAVLAVVVLLVRQPQPPETPYDLNGRGAQGLLALRMWLEEMGYRVQTTGRTRFNLPASADLLFVFPGQQPYTAAERDAVVDWVDAGGALVLAGIAGQDPALVESFGGRSRSGDRDFDRVLAQVQPLLPDAGERLRAARGGAGLDLTDTPRAVPALVRDDGAVAAAVQPAEAGLVWHLSAQVALTNSGLRESDMALLVPALLRGLPAGGIVMFDTYHLFGPGSEANEAGIATLRDWLYRSGAGQGLLLASLLTALYLLLQGVRLGPALPTAAETRRREAAEYVQAMASLRRRARRRAGVAHYHKQRFKIGLARAYHANATLPDAQFLAQLRQTASGLAAEQVQAIAALLAGLSAEPGEAQLVQLVARADAILSRKDFSRKDWQT